MGVQCQILINKAKEGVHRAGHAVTGKVKYYVDEPTEYQEVILSFIGKGKCIWRRGGGKNSRTFVGREHYVTNHSNLLYNKGPADSVTLHGEYESPFEFFLPKDIPRSYKDRTGSITYRIELKFEKASFFSFNKVFTAEIPVYSYVIPPATEGPMIFGLEKSIFALFDAVNPVINVKIEINKTCFTPGENAHLSYVVTNDSDVDITSVLTELYCYTRYTSNCDNTMLLEEKVDNACEAQAPDLPKRQVSSFACLLPTLPELYSIQQSKIISKEYRVKVTLRLPLPHLNEKVELPIVIGEKEGSGEPNIEAEDPDAQPPSYWEAMCEGEKDDEKD